MRLATNQNAFVARRNVGLAADAFTRNVERLSSGLRINRAADDAAGLSIAEKLRAQLRGLLMAQQYTQEGINLVQTADGALDQVSSVLHRMRDLAVQAANTVLSQQ